MPTVQSSPYRVPSVSPMQDSRPLVGFEERCAVSHEEFMNGVFVRITGREDAKAPEKARGGCSSFPENEVRRTAWLLRKLH